MFQGSSLGPVLFIIPFNNVYTYADDSVIYTTSAKDIDTIQRNLSEDIYNLCH